MNIENWFFLSGHKKSDCFQTERKSAINIYLENRKPGKEEFAIDKIMETDLHLVEGSEYSLYYA